MQADCAAQAFYCLSGQDFALFEGRESHGVCAFIAESCDLLAEPAQDAVRHFGDYFKEFPGEQGIMAAVMSTKRKRQPTSPRPMGLSPASASMHGIQIIPLLPVARMTSRQAKMAKTGRQGRRSTPRSSR